MAKAGPAWANVCAVCTKSYQLNPDKDGAITAAEKLTCGKGQWPNVWQRYKDAFSLYPGVKGLLESICPSGLFDEISESRPLSNRQAEDRLENALLGLSKVSQPEALKTIKSLAAEHGPRATWVWAKQGESPLALAIGYIGELAEIVESTGNPATWEALASFYSATGWKADRSVLHALNAARSNSAGKAVTVAIRAVYVPWLEKLSSFTESLAGTYPTTDRKTCRTLPAEEGTVYLFADGMRMDIARSLEEEILSKRPSTEIEFSCNWTALPTITATAKPAWMPLAEKLGGPLEGVDFQAIEQKNGKALVHARFKQLVAEIGIEFLESTDLGSASGCAWTEYGSIDTYGHEQGAKIAWRVDEELIGLEQRIAELLKAGWTKVKGSHRSWLVDDPWRHGQDRIAEASDSVEMETLRHPRSRRQTWPTDDIMVLGLV